MKLENIDLSIEQEVIYELQKNINTKFEEIVKTALDRKGYSFTDEQELMDFVKANCRVEDYIQKKEKVFFVKEEPFLLHKYGLKIETKRNPQ